MKRMTASPVVEAQEAEELEGDKTDNRHTKNPNNKEVIFIGADTV